MFFFSKNINANDKRTLHEFSFTDVDGKKYLLSQHKDKVVLLVNVSIQSVLQEPLDNPKNANLVIITHNAKEKDMRFTLNKISKEKFMAKKITMIRIRNEKKL